MRRAIEARLVRMRDRYGRRGALALVIATGALAFVPIPGITFLPVCIAELARKRLQAV
jgi:hypothetical protein